MQTFLSDLGVDFVLPAVSAFCHHLIRALVGAARHSGQDFAFTDLHRLSRSTQSLKSFLLDRHCLPSPDAQELLAHLDDEAGYVQAVTILSTIRTALEPLNSGPLHALCQPPFLNVSQLLSQGGLLLVPMTDTDFPTNNHLLSAMLDLALNRFLANPQHSAVSVHLHEPHSYRGDRGQRWIDAARRDPQLSLLMDTQLPNRYTPREGAELVFRCCEPLAASLIDDWHLPACTADLTELAPGTGIARLPGMVVTLKANSL
jgi:hypothetical protein